MPRALRSLLPVALLFAAAFTLTPGAGMLAGATGAQAQASSPRGGWALTQRRNPDNKLIEFCGIEAIYDNEFNLILARTPDNKMSLAVGLPEERESFRREPGEPLPTGLLNLEITRSGPSIIRNEVAFAATRPDLLTIPMGEDQEFYTWFGRGNQLIVRGSNTTLTFNLSGTLNAQNDIRSCMCANKPNEPEGLRALRVLLETAGLRNFDFVAVPQGSPLDIYADVIWFYGDRTDDCKLEANQDVVGGMFEREIVEGNPQTFDGQVRAYLDTAKQGCEADVTIQGGQTLEGGTYMDEQVGQTREQGGVKMTLADTSCRNSDGELNHAAMVMASDGRVFTVFFHLGPDSNKEVLRRRRDRIAQLLLRLRPTAQPQ